MNEDDPDAQEDPIGDVLFERAHTFIRERVAAQFEAV